MFALFYCRHIIRVNKCRFWGSWEMEWCLDMDDIVSVPQVTSNELIFNVRQVVLHYAMHFLNFCFDRVRLLG